jgi:hypothetical protein
MEWITMGLKDMPSPFKELVNSVPTTIGETLRKYKIIYIGYLISMVIFVATSVLEVFETPRLLNFLDTYNMDKIVFATMLFSVFMIIYFVREQEKIKFKTHLEEQERVKEGVWIAEQEIRNNIILINQATYVAEKMKTLDGDMIRIIRENTHKMEKHLERLQKADVDPREIRGTFLDEDTIH